ncbi:cupin domain-containing protein [Actinomadura soli]|uniref:Cupin domain-containing protein n=1 Tax=Actinomadura soli TaxID=2508997 RepID=A0A5C4JGA0_9ACTN|nr:cupin domain-containing protein [Actinomadura soli]TMR04318.1 cupin domain-containing protein [Actinomadura soli]
MDTARSLTPTTATFIPKDSNSLEQIGALEGVERPDGLAARILVAGRDMVLIEVHKAKGNVDQRHTHDDHESIALLLSGRMEIEIDGESFVANAGDSWIHYPGVPHSSVALEDSVHLEIKSPPRKTWV